MFSSRIKCNKTQNHAIKPKLKAKKIKEPFVPRISSQLVRIYGIFILYCVFISHYVFNFSFFVYFLFLVFLFSTCVLFFSSVCCMLYNCNAFVANKVPHYLLCTCSSKVQQTGIV